VQDEKLKAFKKVSEECGISGIRGGGGGGGGIIYGTCNMHNVNPQKKY